jgi:hypothetical protein
MGALAVLIVWNSFVTCVEKDITESLTSFIKSIHMPACQPASNNEKIADLVQIKLL